MPVRTIRSPRCLRNVALAFLLGALAAGAARADFIITTLDGPAPHENGTVAVAISSKGVIIGEIYDAQFNVRGFSGPSTGPFAKFELPHGGANDPQRTFMGGVNDDGMIVAHTAPFTPRVPGEPIQVIQNGMVTPLPLPDDFGGTAARGINNAGTITGAFNDLVQRKPRGYVRAAAGNYTRFDATETTQFTFAAAINNHGTIVGNYSILNAITAGFVRTADGTITLLPTPAEIGGKDVFSINYNGINDSGATAGTFQDAAENFYGFVRDVAGEFTLLQHPDSPTQTAMVGLDNRGIVLGTTFDPTTHRTRAFVAVPRVAGDVNCDAVVNNFDIDPFVLALVDPAAYAALFPACDVTNADANQDGRVDNFDIDAFVTLIVGD